MTPFAWRNGAELGDTRKDVEQNIALRLESALAEYAALFVPQTTVINKPSHRGRATSAWQKAIRRGYVDTALRFAHALHGLDEAYVWRRINVIAVEELGVANIELLATILWVSGKKAWRNNNGGSLLVLYWLVEQMCRSVKDRSVTDLCCIADWDPELQQLREELFAPMSTYVSIMVDDVDIPLAVLALDPAAYLPKRVLAGWRMCGTNRLAAENMPEEIEGSWSQFLSLWIDLPAAVQMIMSMASSKLNDGLPVAYPFIYELARQSKTYAYDYDDLAQMPVLGNYPSEAFDQFTREGKKAIGIWSRICSPIAAFLTNDCKLYEDNPKFDEPTRILVFRAEGAQVDRRLVYDNSRAIFDLAEMALNRSQGVPGELNDYAMKLVRQNLPGLHFVRKQVLNMIPPGSNMQAPDPVFPSKAPDSIQFSSDEKVDALIADSSLAAELLQAVLSTPLDAPVILGAPKKPKLVIKKKP